MAPHRPRSATISVVVGNACSNCPLLKLLRGEEYLVYADEFRDYELQGVHWETQEDVFQEHTRWATSFCSRTTQLSGAQEDLDALRGTDLSPWAVRLLAAGVVALGAAGIVSIQLLRSL